MEPPLNSTQSPADFFGVDPIKFNVGDKLPFAYFSVKDEGKTRWICNYGKKPNTSTSSSRSSNVDRIRSSIDDLVIVGVFVHEQNGQTQRDVKYLTMAEAITIKNELIKEGWRPLEPPKIEFTVDGEKKPLNRKQKRYIARKVKTLAKEQK